MANRNKDSGYVDNWQAGKTVTQCNLYMLTTEDCSDVIFRVGSEKQVVRAHRYVLVSRSCVFHAMFCGPLSEKGEVTIPDIEPQVFEEFLRYVYTDTATITPDNVSGLLYTSRKYAVDALLNQCTHFLEKSLSEENVCQILEQCHGYGETDLEQKALKILTEAGEKVIKSKGFLDLCSDCLGTFLKSVDLKLKEEQVFEATLSWTKLACQRDNIPVTHENMRKHLGEMVYEIRFASMSLDYLVHAVGESDVLSDSERARIMDKTVKPGTDISPFKSTPRKLPMNAVSLPCQYVQRLQLYSLYTHPPGTHAISFSVSKKIHLVGFQLYGDVNILGTHHRISVELFNTDNNTNLESFTKTVNRREVHSMTDIMFPNSVILNVHSTYTLCVTISGFTSWGRGGKRSVRVHGVTFTFTHSRHSTAGTTVSEGQIPRLIFKRTQ